jgi:hypothetical protein
MGTRLSSVERCGTIDELTEEMRASRDLINGVQQRTQTNPTGR